MLERELRMEFDELNKFLLDFERRLSQIIDRQYVRR
jgi:hypothetical protein